MSMIHLKEGPSKTLDMFEYVFGDKGMKLQHKHEAKMIKITQGLGVTEKMEAHMRKEEMRGVEKYYDLFLSYEN